MFRYVLALLIVALATPALALPAPMSEQELMDKSDIVAVVRVLFPGSRDKPERQHDAYVDVLRSLLRAPIAQWPEVAHPLHAAALILLDDAHELSDDECALYFAAFP